jgi:hypothetical protein
LVASSFLPALMKMPGREPSRTIATGRLDILRRNGRQPRALCCFNCTASTENTPHTACSLVRVAGIPPLVADLSLSLWNSDTETAWRTAVSFTDQSSRVISSQVSASRRQ